MIDAKFKRTLFCQDIAVGALASVGITLDVDALKFRSKARAAIDAFFESKEVLQDGVAPDLARNAAEDARRVRKCAFDGNAAFRLIKRNKLSVAADEFEVRLLRIKGAAGEV